MTWRGTSCLVDGLLVHVPTPQRRTDQGRETSPSRQGFATSSQFAQNVGAAKISERLLLGWHSVTLVAVEPEAAA